MLVSHGFSLVLAPADGAAPSAELLARRAPHPADQLHSATAPYNLYCFRTVPTSSSSLAAAYQPQVESADRTADRWWSGRERPAASGRQWSFRDRRRRLSV